MAEKQNVSICKDHVIPIRWRCMQCNKWICGDCVALEHKKDTCKIFPLEDAFKEVEKENEKNISKHLCLLPEGKTDSDCLLRHYAKIMDAKNEELQNYQQKVNSVTNEIQGMKFEMDRVLFLHKKLNSIGEDLNNQLDGLKTICSPESFDAVEEKLKKLFKDETNFLENLKCHKSDIVKRNDGHRKNDLIKNKEELKVLVDSGELVFITATEGDTTRYGGLEVNEGAFRINCMGKISPSSCSTCLALDKCLTVVTGGEELPQKFFLKFSSYESGDQFFDVIIRLKKTIKEASKTILQMCFLGNKGKLSFNGCGLRVGQNGSGYFIEFSDELYVPPDVTAKFLLMEQEKQKLNPKEFCISLRNNNFGETLFNFLICGYENDGKKELIPVGELETGFKEFQEVFISGCGGKMRLVNCGWIIA